MRVPSVPVRRLHMAVSRRHFLGLGRYFLAAVALPKKFVSDKLFSSSGRSETARLSSFSMQTFLPLVNSSFAVHSGSTTSTWLTLLSVEDMTPKTRSEVHTSEL